MTEDAKQVYHAAHIFAFSASRKNSAVIFVSVWLANAQNLTRGDGLTDGSAGPSLGTRQRTFLAENLNRHIPHNTRAHFAKMQKTPA